MTPASCRTYDLVWILLLGCAVPLTVACGDDEAAATSRCSVACQEILEHEECDLTFGNCSDTVQDCESTCGLLDELASAAGCHGQESSYYDCLELAPDVCDPYETCELEIDALGDCIDAYCGNNAGDDSCTSYEASFCG